MSKDARPVGPPIEDPAMMRHPTLGGEIPPDVRAAILADLGFAPPRPESELVVADLATRLLASWTVGKPENADEWMCGHAVDTVKRIRMLASGGK